MTPLEGRYSRPDNFFTSLAGVPVHFDRFPTPYGYGSRGKPYQFYCHKPFEEKLDACFAELWTVCPLGKPDLIISAGTWVDRSGEPGRKKGYHELGLAFDLDGIFWPTKTFISKRYPDDPRFYLAIEAVLRKHFGVVLDYNYNAAHHDHFHLDDGDEVGFATTARSECCFVQAALTHVLNIPTPITGVYEDARDSLHLANAGDLKKLKTWMAFLNHVATQGFAPLDV